MGLRRTGRSARSVLRRFFRRLLARLVGADLRQAQLHLVVERVLRRALIGDIDFRRHRAFGARAALAHRQPLSSFG